MKALIKYIVFSSAVLFAFQNCADNQAIKFTSASNAGKYGNGGGPDGSGANGAGADGGGDGNGGDGNGGDGNGGGGGSGGGSGGGNIDPNTPVTQTDDCSTKPNLWDWGQNFVYNQATRFCNQIEVRFCVNGQINRSTNSDSFKKADPVEVCRVGAIRADPNAQGCRKPDGGVLLHGEQAILFESRQVDTNKNCFARTYYCNKGTLVNHANPSERINNSTSVSCRMDGVSNPDPANGCQVWDGTSVPDGASVMRYRYPKGSQLFLVTGQKVCEYAAYRCNKGSLVGNDWPISGSPSSPHVGYSGCNPLE